MSKNQKIRGGLGYEISYEFILFCGVALKGKASKEIPKKKLKKPRKLISVYFIQFRCNDFAPFGQLACRHARLPASQPARKPVSQPASQPAGQPAGRPASQPAGQPAMSPGRAPLEGSRLSKCVFLRCENVFFHTSFSTDQKK